MNIVFRIPSCRTVTSLDLIGRLFSSAQDMLVPNPDNVLTIVSTQKPSTHACKGDEASMVMPIVPFTSVPIQEKGTSGYSRRVLIPLPISIIRFVATSGFPYLYITSQV